MQWERGGASPSRAWVSQWREQQCGGLGRKHTPRAPAAFLVRRAGCVRPTCAGSALSATSRPVAVAASLVSRLSFRLLLRESVLPRRAVGRNTRNEEASALSKRKLGIPEPRPTPARSCCPAPHGGPVRSAFCPSVVVLTETFLRRACFWGRFSNDRCSDRICLTVYIEGHRGPQGPRKGGADQAGEMAGCSVREPPPLVPPVLPGAEGMWGHSTFHAVRERGSIWCCCRQQRGASQCHVGQRRETCEAHLWARCVSESDWRTRVLAAARVRLTCAVLVQICPLPPGAGNSVGTGRRS